MEEIINCELWDENDGIYIQFDYLMDSNIYRQIADKLINIGYDDYGSYQFFTECDEPSWSDIADAREDIDNVVNELGYKLKWL